MSVVRPVGYQNGSGHCGYCKGRGYSSYGMMCQNISAEDYERLMLIGWRRCGDYFYKPDLRSSCCKLNTIRLNVQSFQSNKDQRRALNKFNRYLYGAPQMKSKKELKEEYKSTLRVPDDLNAGVREAVLQVSQNMGLPFMETFVKIQRNDSNRKVKFGDFTITSAHIIKGFAIKQGKEVGQDEIADYLRSALVNILHPEVWEVFAIGGFVNVNAKFELEAQQVRQEQEVQDSHQYSVQLVPDNFTQEAFEVYKKYQVAIHKDKPNQITPRGYTRFLCDSSVQRQPPNADYPLGLGGFHMQHRIDGKLVGVGVLDILPSGLSSVYFYYDPDYQFLSLGVVSALKEIELIFTNRTGTFTYYYMGFYIDTCQKMRYKGKFYPSELLCPVTYRWVPIEHCLRDKSHGFLQLNQCCPQTRDQGVDENMDFSSISLAEFLNSNLQLYIQGQIAPLSIIPEQFKSSIVNLLSQAAPFFGKQALSTLYFELR